MAKNKEASFPIDLNQKREALEAARIQIDKQFGKGSDRKSVV